MERNNLILKIFQRKRVLQKPLRWSLCLFMFLSITMQGEQEVLVVPSWAGEKIVLSTGELSCVPFPSTKKFHEETCTWSLKKLDEKLHKKNIEMRAYDFSAPPSVNTKVILCKNCPNWIPQWVYKINCAKPVKMFLWMYEPPSVEPEMYTERVLSLYDTVFTWNDDLVDGKKFIKLCYPSLRMMIPQIPEFSQKKLLTMVSGNKRSSHVNELYSERKKVIEFFENREGVEFEFYGTGWENEGYKNFKGEVDDKTETIKNYKFCICYENIKDMKGYITEKIFDCFAAGCVPIYWGASNIKEYIPEGCYILREDFHSMEELLYFIKNMNKKKYDSYIYNIKKFLNSKKAKLFTEEHFATTVATYIET